LARTPPPIPRGTDTRTNSPYFAPDGTRTDRTHRIWLSDLGGFDVLAKRIRLRGIAQQIVKLRVKNGTLMPREQINVFEDALYLVKFKIQIHFCKTALV
jgi:hypothetical protein